MSVLYRWTIEERSRTSKDPLQRQLKIELESAEAGFSALREQFERPLLMIMSVVGLLLFIACTNVALMLLARDATRRAEMAVRVSLGARRSDVIRQALTESLLLSLAGALAGIAFAYFFTTLLLHVVASGRPIPGFPPHLEIHVAPDLRVVFLTAGAALATGLLFGAVPAWTAFSRRTTHLAAIFGPRGRAAILPAFCPCSGDLADGALRGSAECCVVVCWLFFEPGESQYRLPTRSPSTRDIGCITHRLPAPAAYGAHRPVACQD